MNRFGILATSAALSLVAAPVFAADADPSSASAEKVASGHYERGVKLYEAADYALSLAEFERAYELTRNYRILFNIGNVHFQLAAYGRARTAFEQYLREGGDSIAPPRRAQVERDLGDLAIRTARLVISVSEPDAEIRVDGHLLGKSPLRAAEWVDGGTRHVVVRKDGFVTQEQDVRVVGGDDRSIRFALVKVTVVPAATSKGSDGLWLGWSATGVLLAGTVVSGVAWSAADGKLSDLKSSTSTRTERDEQARTVNTWMYLTGGLGLATLAAGGTTLYFSLRSTETKGANAASLVVAPQPGGLVLRGAF